MSGTENWTLALSWDLEQRALKGIIHGLQSNEVSNLVTYLGDSREDLIHPMSLLVVLCEMLTEGDSNGIKRRATELYQVEIRTNYHGYPRDETIEVCACLPQICVAICLQRILGCRQCQIAGEGLGRNDTKP